MQLQPRIHNGKKELLLTTVGCNEQLELEEFAAPEERLVAVIKKSRGYAELDIIIRKEIDQCKKNQSP